MVHVADNTGELCSFGLSGEAQLCRTDQAKSGKGVEIEGVKIEGLEVEGDLLRPTRSTRREAKSMPGISAVEVMKMLTRSSCLICSLPCASHPASELSLACNCSGQNSLASAPPLNLCPSIAVTGGKQGVTGG